MPASLVPRIEVCPGPDDREGWVVYAPFNPGFIEEVKAHLAGRDRRYWPESRAWWVADEHHAILVFLLHRFWEEYEVAQEDGSVEIVTRSGERIRQGGLFA